MGEDRAGGLDADLEQALGDLTSAWRSGGQRWEFARAVLRRISAGGQLPDSEAGAVQETKEVSAIGNQETARVERTGDVTVRDDVVDRLDVAGDSATPRT